MKAEEYLAKFREDALEIVDDPNEDIDFRFCCYFKHVGRLEALVMTDRITMDRYAELMSDWNKHWPGGKQ